MPTCPDGVAFMIQFRRVRLARSALPWMDWGSERRASRAGGFSGLMVRTLFRTSRVAHWLIFKTRLRTIDDSSVSPRQSLHRSSSRPKIERHRAYSQSRYAHAPGILQSASAADMGLDRNSSVLDCGSRTDFSITRFIQSTVATYLRRPSALHFKVV